MNNLVPEAGNCFGCDRAIADIDEEGNIIDGPESHNCALCGMDFCSHCIGDYRLSICKDCKSVYGGYLDHYQEEDEWDV